MNPVRSNVVVFCSDSDDPLLTVNYPKASGGTSLNCLNDNKSQ